MKIFCLHLENETKHIPISKLTQNANLIFVGYETYNNFAKPTPFAHKLLQLLAAGKLQYHIALQLLC